MYFAGVELAQRHEVLYAPDRQALFDFRVRRFQDVAKRVEMIFDEVRLTEDETAIFLIPLIAIPDVIDMVNYHTGPLFLSSVAGFVLVVFLHNFRGQYTVERFVHRGLNILQQMSLVRFHG